ncbi:MAG: hypothetical protein ACKVQT_35575, partial [Burkholderiales bacterium]
SKPTERYFVKLLQSSNSAAKRYMDIVAAESDYRDYVRFLAKTAFLRFPKMVSTLLAGRSIP